MTTVKSLIKQLQGIPNSCEVVGFDIKVLDPKTKTAQHLFLLDIDEDNEPTEEKPKNTIGF